ncbi:MAG: c-type cytochrome [Campylobacterales bacterium]|nr:c-type cytochrome [Campylobacterales bacterium]
MKKIVIATIFAGATMLMADGAATYATKCASCHGADGKTPALGKSAPIAGMDAATAETEINGYKAGTLNKYGMGATMKGMVVALDDATIKEVATYVSTLK